MSETLSIRIPDSEFKQIALLAKEESAKRSEVLRDVLIKGIAQRKVERAIDHFRKGQVTAWKAARMAGIPLTRFLDLLKQEGLEFHYSADDLREDLEGI